MKKVLFKYLEKNKQMLKREAEHQAALGAELGSQTKSPQKILLKTLSKELLDYKKSTGAGHEADSRTNQILNVQVSKFGESHRCSKARPSFDGEDKLAGDNLLNNLSFGRRRGDRRKEDSAASDVPELCPLHPDHQPAQGENQNAGNERAAAQAADRELPPVE